MFSEDLGGSVLDGLTALGETDLAFVQQRNGGQGSSQVDPQGMQAGQMSQHPGSQGMAPQPPSDQGYYGTILFLVTIYVFFPLYHHLESCSSSGFS